MLYCRTIDLQTFFLEDFDSVLQVLLVLNGKKERKNKHRIVNLQFIVVLILWVSLRCVAVWELE